MINLSKGTVLTLSTAAILISIITAASPGYARPGIIVDGVVADRDWAWATKFDLGGGYRVYIMNDKEFLYVAFSYPIKSIGDSASFSTYKEGAFSPETIAGPYITSKGEVWDTIVDEDGDNVPETLYREEPTKRYRWAVESGTEIKVPLAELRLSPGETIKAMFFLDVLGKERYVYPRGADAFNVNTYKTITLSGYSFPTGEVTRVATLILLASGIAITLGSLLHPTKYRKQ